MVVGWWRNQTFDICASKRDAKVYVPVAMITGILVKEIFCFPSPSMSIIWTTWCTRTPVSLLLDLRYWLACSKLLMTVRVISSFVAEAVNPVNIQCIMLAFSKLAPTNVYKFVWLVENGKMLWIGNIYFVDSHPKGFKIW